jgi:hypothetical protein
VNIADDVAVAARVESDVAVAVVDAPAGAQRSKPFQSQCYCKDSSATKFK